MPSQSKHPVVVVPNAAEDRPMWARVGAIAFAGFVIGIAWPKLAGVRLGPVPPEETRAASSASASAGTLPVAHAPASAAPVSSAAPAPGASAGGQHQAIAVTAGKVVSCKNPKGKTLEECDTPDFDAIALPILKGLSKCPAASGLNGKLSIGYELDFSRNKARVIRGKSTTVQPEAAKGIWQCVETESQKVKLDDVTHQQAKYSVFYTVQFVPPGKTPDIEVAKEKAAEPAVEEKKDKEVSLGAAQVVYDVALVRDEPKEGKVVARLIRGTRVELLSRKAGWYKIRFGDKEGWVYRGSVAQ